MCTSILHSVQKIKWHIVHATVCNNLSSTTALHDQRVFVCTNFHLTLRTPPLYNTTNPCVGLSCCTNFLFFSWPRFAQAGGQQAGSSCCFKWASVVQPCLWRPLCTLHQTSFVSRHFATCCCCLSLLAAQNFLASLLHSPLPWAWASVIYILHNM